MSTQPDPARLRLPREILCQVIACVPVYDLPLAWVNFRQVCRSWKVDTEHIFATYHLQKLTIRLPDRQWEGCELEFVGFNTANRQLAVFQSVKGAPEWPEMLHLGCFHRPLQPQPGYREQTYPMNEQWHVCMDNVTDGDPTLVDLQVHGDRREKKLKLQWVPLLNQLLGEELLWRRNIMASIYTTCLAARAIRDSITSNSQCCWGGRLAMYYFVNMRSKSEGMVHLRKIRFMRSRPGQPVCYNDNGSIPYWEKRCEFATTWIRQGVWKS